jgi:predicted anti-sigma-YlaC factor YlaD
MSEAHASAQLIGWYVGGDTAIPGDELWALEAHLENCPVCRGRLAEAVAEQTPDVTSMLGGIWSELEPLAVGTPAPVRRRHWVATWASPTLVPWLAMTALVMGLALLVDWADSATGRPSLVQLLAPVAPLLGVAVSWARGLDPAYELTSATPRAGLYLVLRRTMAVLVVVIPLLLVVGWAAETSIALSLLPCLAFTSATLALGGVIGVSRAAISLALVWVVLVVGPILAGAMIPLVLDPAGLPLWGAAFVLGVVTVVARSEAYARLGSHR